jgi:nucleotide-binding universal stress UspA family protein
MLSFGRIVVGLAGTPLDRELTAYAAMLAGLRHREPPSFSFVHVLGEQPDTSYEAALARIQSEVAEVFQSGNPSVPATCTVLSGTRVDRLLEFAASNAADLLLIGHHRSRSGRRSLARRLAMNAPCSVWMIPEGSRPAIDRVVAAVDFSGHSASAFGVAAAIGQAAGVEELVALHVRSGEGDGDQESLSQFTASLDPLSPRVTKLVEDNPDVAEGILGAASRNGASLIVMGSRGSSRSLSILLGAEAEQVLRHSTIPVLIVKPAGAHLDFLRELLDRDFSAQPGHPLP